MPDTKNVPQSLLELCNPQTRWDTRFIHALDYAPAMVKRNRVYSEFSAKWEYPENKAGFAQHIGNAVQVACSEIARDNRLVEELIKRFGTDPLMFLNGFLAFFEHGGEWQPFRVEVQRICKALPPDARHGYHWTSTCVYEALQRILHPFRAAFVSALMIAHANKEKPGSGQQDANQPNGGEQANELKWQDVQKELQAKANDGKPFTSYKKLGKELGCSPNTVRKAVENSPSRLHNWIRRSKKPQFAQEGPKVPRARSLTDIDLDNIEADRESRMNELIQDQAEDMKNEYARGGPRIINRRP